MKHGVLEVDDKIKGYDSDGNGSPIGELDVVENAPPSFFDEHG